MLRLSVFGPSIVLALWFAGCREPSATSIASTTDEALPPDIEVAAHRADLVYSFRDPSTGQLTNTTSIAAIPEDAKERVIVTDLSLTPEQRRADRYVYIADLRAPRPDGTFPVAIASRYAVTSPQGEGGETEGAKEGVVLYTTNWCGVCKKAKAVLRSLGVPFIERDIEASKSAAEELSRKARAAGIEASGVPVIDVGGTLLQGLDEATLKAVLKQKGLLRGR